MIADRLLSRLSGVRETGSDHWLALCPAHEDRSPSLSIREMENKVLVHCFAQCAVQDVLAAVGLGLSDLFPDLASINYEGRRRPQAKPIPARDILTALRHEFAVVAIASADLARGDALDPGFMKRIGVAHSRFLAAIKAGGIR